MLVHPTLEGHSPVNHLVHLRPMRVQSNAKFLPLTSSNKLISVMLFSYRATWPYEVLLLPRRHVKKLPDLTEEEQKCNNNNY